MPRSETAIKITVIVIGRRMLVEMSDNYLNTPNKCIRSLLFVNNKILKSTIQALDSRKLKHVLIV